MTTNLRSLSDLFRATRRLAVSCAFATAIAAAAAAQTATNTFPNNGNAGVNTISPPNPLTVSRSGSAPWTGRPANELMQLVDKTDNTPQILFGSTYNGMFLRYTGTGHTAPNQRFGILTGGLVEAFSLNNDGNVGIGTTDPSLGGAVASRFTVTQADASTGLSLGNSAGTPRFALNGNSNGTWTMWDYGSGAWAAGITQKSGSVGIGNVNPTYKLDVNGEINASGLRINGTPISGGGGSQWSGTSSIYYNGGSVGVGTGTPTRLFSLNAASTTYLSFNEGGAEKLVIGTEAAGYNRRFIVFDSSAGQYRFMIDNSGNVGIGTVTPGPSYKLDVAGNINSSGTITGNNIAAKYQDVAEWVPSSEQLSAGTVVVLDTTKSNQVVSSGTAYDTRVAGVISAQPGITLGESGEGKVLVATTGRVRVKVDASRGPIQIGDLLVTSDVVGVAMKSESVEFAGRKMHMPGTIIGKALEPLAKGKGEILVLLSLQ